MSTVGVDDSELVALARGGDTAAFGTLVGRHQLAVYRAALAALGSREDAEDVAQDAFLDAFRHLSRFRQDASFKTWVVTIAWRKALTRRRSVRTRLQRFLRSADTDRVWDWPDPGRSQEAELVGAEWRQRVREVIAALSPSLRDTLLLAASEEYTMDEIAVLLGVPAGTVKWRISEARRRIRQALADGDARVVDTSATTNERPRHAND